MFPDFGNVTYYQVKVGIFFWVKTSINGLLCLMLSWSHWSSVVCLKSVACHLQAYKLNLVAGVVQKSPLFYLEIESLQMFPAGPWRFGYLSSSNWRISYDSLIHKIIPTKDWTLDIYYIICRKGKKGNFFISEEDIIF